MKILVIGRDKGLIETARVLAEGLKLPLVDDYRAQSKAVQDLQPGVYVSYTMTYQQAKTLAFETIVVNRPGTMFSAKQSPGSNKVYKVIDSKTGELFIRNGVPTNCLSLSGANQIANKINAEANAMSSPIAVVKLDKQ